MKFFDRLAWTIVLFMLCIVVGFLIGRIFFGQKGYKMSSARNHKMRSRYSYMYIPFSMFARNAQQVAFVKAQKEAIRAAKTRLEEAAKTEVEE